MIVTTQSGSRYEIDLAELRARKIEGDPTEMTSDGWRPLETVSIYAGRLLLVWDAPGVIAGNRATLTSPVVHVEHDAGTETRLGLGGLVS